MYHNVHEFLEEWQFEVNATLKIFSALTDESLSQKVTESGRSLGRLAWHITITVGEMLSRTGLKYYSVDENAEVPKTAKEILDEYKKTSDALVEAIKQNWNDDSLEQEVNMYGENWKNGVTLQVLIKHQIHHRGQMTVLMRQAGLKVPGIYGPANEEWSAMGLPAMK